MIYGKEARERIAEGMNMVVNPVGATAGPMGRNASIGRSYGPSSITNDGVSISKAILEKGHEDDYVTRGIDLINQAAEETDSEVHDGTTTTIILTGALFNNGMKYVELGFDSLGIERGIKHAKNLVIDELKKGARKVLLKRELYKSAYISSESEDMAEVIADMVMEVGVDGIINIEESLNPGITKDTIMGMTFDRGFLSPTDDTELSVKDTFILIAEKHIDGSIENIVNLTEGNLVIIADSFDEKLLYELSLMRLEGMNIIPITSPEFTDNRKRVLKDIAIMTGGQVISSQTPLRDVKLEQLGNAKKVISTRETTTIIDGAGAEKEINTRVREIEYLITKVKVLSDREFLKKRIARLRSGIGVIRIGASSEVERKRLKDKLEDAISATRIAYKSGVVIGGGGALAKIKLENPFTNENERAGFDIFMKSINAPLLQIVSNAKGLHEEVVLDKVKNGTKYFGYNTKDGRFENDMFKAGIVDPLDVIIKALDSSVSVATSVLTIETAI